MQIPENNVEIIEFHEERKRKVLRPILILLLAVIVITFLYNSFFSSKRHYTGYDIEAKTEKGSLSETEYLGAGGKLLALNKEGIAAYGNNAELSWNSGVSLKNPRIVVAGSFIAAADIGGKTLMVMDQEKTPVTPVQIQTVSGILEISVSERGHVAALMQEEDGYMIRIFDAMDKNNKLKAEIKTFSENDGYALQIALSKDGSKLVTEFIKSDGNRIKSTLTFYNFASTGESSNADRIVGIFPYTDTIFPKLTFLDNNTVCAFGDNKICTFRMKFEPELLWEKEFHGKLLKAEGDEKGIAVLTSGAGGYKGGKTVSGSAVEVLDKDYAGQKADVVFGFTPGGKKTVEKVLDFTPDGMNVNKGEIILYSDASCLILREDGGVKYADKFGENIINFLPGAQKDRYFLVTGAHIELLKLNE